MQKIIPIKLERSTRYRNTRIIEWRLSNICNFNCSFCPSEFKDGSKKYLNYDRYINIINDLIDNDLTKVVWFQFTGGEPTLYSKLFQLLEHIKNKGGYTSLISNGSRTIRWWKELAEKKLLDRLYLTHHPEQKNSPDHIIEVNNIMQLSNTLSTMFVTTQSDHELFKKAVTHQEIILENAATISSLKPINGDDTKFQPYTELQLETIQKNLYVKSNSWNTIFNEKHNYLKSIPWYQSGMTMTFSNGSVKNHSAQYFIENNLTNFKGWSCDIGKNMISIEIDSAFRGMCKSGGTIADLNNQYVKWQETSIVCQKENCICSLDVQEPKILIN